MSEHPDSDRLAVYATRSLADNDKGVVEAHLAACTQCSDVIADAALFLRLHPDSNATAVADRATRFRAALIRLRNPDT